MDQSKPSIRTIVILAAGALVALLVTVGLVMVDRAQRRMTAAVEESLTGYARVVALAHSQWISESEALLASLATVVRSGEVASGACTGTLARLLNEARGYDTFLIAGPKGDVWCAPTRLDKPVNLADRDYFKRALDMRAFVAGDYLVGRVSGLRVLPVAYPVLDGKGEVEFVIVAGKRLAWFERLVAGLDLPQHTHVALMDDRGIVLGHFPPFDSLEDSGALLTPLLGDAAREHRVAVVAGPGHVEESGGRIYAYVPIDRMRLGVAVSSPEAFALAGVHAFRWEATITLVAALLGSTVLALVFLRGLVLTPLSHLVHGTRAIRSGDLSWRMGRPARVAEVAELYRSFDAMVESLSRHEEMSRLQSAELERSNADLEHFAYTVSHDLREPLRTVSSFVRLIERRYESKLDDEGREFMAYVTDGAERMSRMLDGVLEYSRIESRGAPPAPVELDGPLDTALRSLTLVIEETGARIERGPLPRVLGDADQLSRLFQNLVANAIKFRKPDTAPDIRITARQIGNLWEIAVADNGVGLPAEGRDTLFQLFRRLVTRDQVPGDGVGLALCKRIVERHGGTIRVESQPGQGATFRFTLPGA